MKKSSSWTKIALWAVAFVLAGSMAMAQDDKKIEVGVNFGYTLSEGVDINPTNLGFGTIEKVNPTNSMSWGFNIDYLATENFSVGFLWDDQPNKINVDLVGGATDKLDIAENHTYNYHGVFTYNVGEADSRMRPYFFGGLGATHLSGGNVIAPPIAIPVQATEVGSETQFSTTWGGGVKFLPASNVGLKLEMRWTPTYIKTDPAGWWCGGYWGCWPVGDSDYSNQLKFAAHLFFAF